MEKEMLPTNFTDDVLSESMNGYRQYVMTENENNTVSFKDVTVYENIGSEFGADEINKMSEAINNSKKGNDFIGTQAELEAAIAAGTTYEGMTAYVDDETEEENPGSQGCTGAYYSLSGGTEISEGTDLNDEAYKKIGNYYCKLISIASTLLNCPVQRAFTMKVMYGTGENYKQQLIKEYDTGNIWMRTFASNETDIAMEWTRIGGNLSDLEKLDSALNPSNFDFKLKKYVDTTCSSHIEVLQKCWNDAFSDAGAAGAYRIVLTNYGSSNVVWTCYTYGNGLYGYALNFSHNSVPFYCQINNGNWITNVELINDNNLYKKGIVLAGGTVIPANANLDDYKIPGNYYCDSNSVGDTIINSPISTAFKMIVDYASGSGYVRQTCIPLLTDVYPIYTRRLQDTGGWTAWKRFVTEDDLKPQYGKVESDLEGVKLQYGYTGNVVCISGYITTDGLTALSNGQVLFTLPKPAVHEIYAEGIFYYGDTANPKLLNLFVQRNRDTCLSNGPVSLNGNNSCYCINFSYIAV